MNRNLIFISGYTKLPKGTTAYEIYGGLILALEVDKETGVITQFECSLITKVAISFLENIIVGESLSSIERIENQINRLYFGAAKKAVLSALNICADKYQQICNNQEVHDEVAERN
ncbi:MAG: DUF3870 domain-containing protein [Tissierellia bacterium]|nr:DUF3870 domain-containing protein [Tissierellia bacterium]